MNNLKDFHVQFVKWVLDFIQTNLSITEDDVKKRLSDEIICSLKNNPMNYRLNGGSNSNTYDTDYLLERCHKVLKSHYQDLLESGKIKHGIRIHFVIDEGELSLNVLCTAERLLGLIFITALESVKKGNLLHCPECSKIFLHVTKQRKIYCSNKCYSRHIVRRKRMEL